MKTANKKDIKISNMERENNVLALALSDLANGNVKWFQRFNYAIGISRPNGASGGIAIEKVIGGIVSAYYWEDFCKDSLSHIASVITGENTPFNAELIRRRSCIEDAQAYVNEQHMAAQSTSTRKG